MGMSDLILIAYNIRSTHNVGALFRTAEGMGVKHIICAGYTPYPRVATAQIERQPYSDHTDTRLPHEAEKLTQQIHKTALGAETMVPFSHSDTLDFSHLRKLGYTIVGLEQDERSHPLHEYSPPTKIALLIGEEVHGIPHDLRNECDEFIEIPMYGKKESFNVSVATGIALYALRINQH